MIFLSILIFILAISLPFFKNQITPLFFTRIAALSFIYAGMLTFNTLHIQSIGSGIGIYSGFFQATYFSLFIETFLYIVGALILLSWSLIKGSASKGVESFTFLNFNIRRSIQKISRQNLKNERFLPIKEKEYVAANSLNINAAEPLNSHAPFKADSSPAEQEGLNKAPSSIILPLTGLGSESKEYSLIALFSTLGGSLLLSSGDLLSMYLSIELQSFGLYVLATIYRDSSSATGAGLKYFLLGGLSSCLILLGGSLIYSITGLTNFDSIYSLLSVINSSSLAGAASAAEPLLDNGINQGISLGLILIIVGFLFKIAGAPFHNWSPDVYDESPTNVTIWLTIMPKITIIIFLLELEMGIASQLTQTVISEFSTTNDSFFSMISNINVAEHNIISDISLRIGESVYVIKNIFLLSSLLSLIIGTVVGLAQVRIKRLLAYSTISHIGFILLALSINTEQSTESLILYLIQYIITSLNTFLILLAFGYIIKGGGVLAASMYSAYKDKGQTSALNINSDINFIYELKGQFSANPILSFSLAICLFSMAGIPPLIGFFGKQSVLYAAIENGNIFMALLAIIVSVISAYYYLRIIKELHTGAAEPENLLSYLATQKEKESQNFLLESYTGQTKTGTGIGTETETVTDTDTAVAAWRSQPLKEITKNRTPALPLKKNSWSPYYQFSYILTNIHSFIIATLTLSILLFILKPSIILNSTVLLSLSLFNG